MACAVAIAALGIVTVPATAAAADAVDVARAHVQSNPKAFGLTGADVDGMVVSSVVPSRHSGVTHVYFEQRHRGVGVWNGILTVNVAADGTVISTGSRFVANLASAAAGQNPKRTATEAAAAASGHLGLEPSKPFHVVSKKGTDEATVLTAVFGGFISPVDDPPAINTANAGATVAVKFTVSDPGAAWSSDSQPVDCVSLEITGEAPEPLASPGSTGLQQEGDAYHVNWKTDGSWSNTCRKLTLRLPAASDAVAYFSFF